MKIKTNKPVKMGKYIQKYKWQINFVEKKCQAVLKTTEMKIKANIILPITYFC